MGVGRVCSIAGCNRPLYAKQLCGTHYQRARLGRAMYVPIQARGRVGCKVANCAGKHYAKGYCARHYERHSHGIPLGAPPRGYRKWRLCKAEGCTRPHYCGGFCASHYQRVKRGVSTVKPVRRYRETDTRTYDTDTARRAVEADLKAFLANGGKVTRC